VNDRRHKKAIDEGPNVVTVIMSGNPVLAVVRSTN